MIDFQKLSGRTIKEVMARPSHLGPITDIRIIFEDGGDAHIGATNEGALVCVSLPNDQTEPRRVEGAETKVDATEPLAPVSC